MWPVGSVYGRIYESIATIRSILFCAQRYVVQWILRTGSSVTLMSVFGAIDVLKLDKSQCFKCPFVGQAGVEAQTFTRAQLNSRPSPVVRQPPFLSSPSQPQLTTKSYHKR